jgi:cytochrome bd-type quinol oxidase subunit 2
MTQPAAPRRKRVAVAAATVLIMVAIALPLAVPSYARSAPKLADFPFFYWYQLILVPVIAILCWLCYLLLRTKPAPAPESPNGQATGPAR